MTQLPEFVEVDEEAANRIEDMTRADAEPNPYDGWAGDIIDAVREQDAVRHIPDGLQVHFEEAFHDEVHAILAKMLDSTPEEFYDSSNESEVDGYDRYYAFTLRRDDENDPWTVPRFTPGSLFTALRPVSDHVKVIALGRPLQFQEQGNG